MYCWKSETSNTKSSKEGEVSTNNGKSKAEEKIQQLGRNQTELIIGPEADHKVFCAILQQASKGRSRTQIEEFVNELYFLIFVSFFNSNFEIL